MSGQSARRACVRFSSTESGEISLETINGCHELRNDQIIELLVDRVVVKDTEVEIRYVIPTSPSSEHVHFCHLRTDYFSDSSFILQLLKLITSYRVRFSRVRSLGAVTGKWEVNFSSHEFIHYLKIPLNYLLLVKILLNKRPSMLAHHCARDRRQGDKAQ